jgi:hypothetical protein
MPASVSKVLAEAPSTRDPSALRSALSKQHPTRFWTCKSLFNRSDRVLRAILVRVRACSAVQADTISRAVPANMRKLRPSAPEPEPTKESGETNPTFRFVSACALLALAILKIGFGGFCDFK